MKSITLFDINDVQDIFEDLKINDLVSENAILNKAKSSDILENVMNTMDLSIGVSWSNLEDEVLRYFKAKKKEAR